MGTAPSEKLRGTVSWTTRAQGRLATLLEVDYPTVSYRPWPGAVVLRPGWDEPFDYWPAMGVERECGATVFIDVRHGSDVAERERIGFDILLRTELARRGIRLHVVDDCDLAADPRLPVAREVRQFARWRLPQGDGSARELGDMVVRQGRVTMGELRDVAGFGDGLVARACVLAMRRRLRLVASPEGFEASAVEAPAGGGVL